MTRKSRPIRHRAAAFLTAAALAAALALPVFSPTGATATTMGLGPPNTFAATGPLGVAQSGQTATLLPNGKVLIAAGGTTNAELYDPATRRFSATGPMPVAVTNATATLLPSGKVLVAGGLQGSHQVTNAELYDPATGTWAATGAMNVARSGQTATLLPDGQVLVAGGGCNGSGFGCDSGSFEGTDATAELYNPATATWTKTGTMSAGREFFTATLLSTGKVLAAGGFNNCDDSFCTDLKTAELYDTATGKWSLTGSMHAAREQHSATLLGNGEVLVAGGLNEGGFCCSQGGYSSAELYNPASETWTPAASMATVHAGQTATLLHDGSVLIAGGGTAVAELYQPQRNIWVSPGPMSTVRTHQTATLLPDGHVLVAAGDGPDGQPQSTAEEFLAGKGPLVTVTPGSLAFGGQQVGTVSGTQFYKISNVGSADLVSSGASLTGQNPGDFRIHTDCSAAPVAPGGSCAVSVRFAPATTELRTALALVSDNAPRSPQGVAVSGFGGGPDSWVPVGPMSGAREHATATLLPGGKVLVAGGQTAADSGLATAELYNPATRSFSPTGSLNTARAYAAAILLPDGKVLVTGGVGANSGLLSSAELYDPATSTWANTTPTNASGYAETSTLLPDGKVLVTGFGANPGEVYDPAAATWTNTGPMPAAPFFATATLLKDGQVLLAGGGTSAAELYSPATNTWTATGALNDARQSAAAALLPDGDVLVAGGSAPNGGGSLASAELYDPATGKWSRTGALFAPSYFPAMTLLPNGIPLLIGGCNTCSIQPALANAEEFDASSGFWFPVNAMTQPRVFHTATLLNDGNVLVAGGGRSYDGAAVNTAELFTPVLLAVNPASGPAGAQVTVTGSGFFAGESVTLSFDFSVIGHTKTTPAGTFSTTITVPQANAGPHTVFVQARRSFATATTTFTVTG